MTQTQLIEGYVELNLDLEAEQACRGTYPHEIGAKLSEWMERMRKEDVREGDELLERVRAVRAMGNL